MMFLRRSPNRLMSPWLHSAAVTLGLAASFAADPPGSLDTGFSPTLDQTVFAVAVQTNGRILIGGDFTRVNGSARSHLARLNADGSLDTGFGTAAGANESVRALAVQEDGRCVIGGDFTALEGAAWTRVGRLNADGTPDATFNQGAFPNGRVLAVAVQPDGRILLGGSFTQVGGVTRNYVARLQTDGSLDQGFNAHADGHVYALALQRDGKVLIGGDFVHVNNSPHRSIARLDPDGSIDESFAAEADTTVHAIALFPGGEAVIGGAFGRVNGEWRDAIARLKLDGSIDAAFNAGVSGGGAVIYSLALQPNGKLILGGYFRQVNGVNRMNLARLNANGLLDPMFDPGAGPDYRVRSVVIQGDGRVLVGGEFSTVNFMDHSYLARVAGDPLEPSGTPLEAEIWNAVEIGWRSESNAIYQVQWSSETEPAFWQNLGPVVTGNGTTNSIFDSRRVMPRRFYRVLKTN